MSLIYSYHEPKKSQAYERKKMEEINYHLIEKNQNARILVVLHFFYPDSWKEINTYLLNLECYNWDLIVTYPDFLSEEDLLPIRQFKKDVILIKCENLGYDIRPFFIAIEQINLDEYDIVFKLQSKGVKRKKIFIYKQLFFGRDWFVNLFEGCLGVSNVHRTINTLVSSNQIGAVCAKNLIVRDPSYKETLVIKQLEKNQIEAERGYKFVAGTCFAIRARLLKKFQMINFNKELYQSVSNARGISFAHSLERYFGISVSQSGYEIEGNEVCSLWRKVKHPLEIMLSTISSEKLLYEDFIIDDEYFHWILDNKFVRYKLRKIKLGQLKYYSHEHNRDIFLENCVPYRYLKGDRVAYEEYSRYHLENGLPAMTPDRFEALIKSMKESGFDSRNIIIVNERNTICDGQHRACYLAYEYGLDFEIEVLEIEMINRKQLIKLIVPKWIKKIYYKKKYGCY